jgi:hypothetical protein
MHATARTITLSSLILVAFTVLCLAALLAISAARPASGQAPPAQKPAPEPVPAPDPGQGGTAVKQEYQALLERVKKSDMSVDFTKLRRLHTQLDTYDPYGVESQADLSNAFASGDPKQVKWLAERNLETNYLDLDAHAAAAAAADRLGERAAADHHRYVLQGVVDSVLASGDGKTPETAYTVVAISEEYATMAKLGLEVMGQALVRDGEHAYDLLHGMDPGTKATREVYFNIDPLMRALDKKFSQ